MVEYDCAVSYSTPGGIQEATLSKRRPEPKPEPGRRETLREMGEAIEKCREVVDKWKDRGRKQDGETKSEE